MMTVLLLIAAAAFVGREWIVEQARRISESATLPKVNSRQLVVAALLTAAAWSYWSGRQGDGEDKPTPAPPAGPIVLAGKFVGPDASRDAAAMASLCEELAENIEYDAMRKPEPKLRTGRDIEELRTTARDGRMRGISIGDRNPLVRQAIHEYLDRPDVLGPSSGEFDAEGRSRWVAAFREIARAAEAAIK